jgi:WD40 repeat protein
MKHEISPLQCAVEGAVFNKDESKILTWGGETTRVWNSKTGTPLLPSMTSKSHVIGAIFNQNESEILTWSYDGTVQEWDGNTGVPTLPPLGHKGWVGGATFTKKEDRIITWCDDYTARIWDSKTGALLLAPMTHKNWVRGATFNKDESKILTWSTDGTAKVWDISIDTTWPVAQIILKVEVETGTKMTATGAVQVLPAAEWKKKKWCEYDAIKYQLKQISEEEWQTSKRLCEQLTASASEEQEVVQQ